MDKIVLITGGFDPLHSGHIEYIKAARQIGRVVVGINSDAWLERKKGRSFMPFSERLAVMENLKNVTACIAFDDADNSAKDAIVKTRRMFPTSQIVFANGGDRTQENILEMNVKDDNLKFAFGVGGENKQNSSSWILQEWKAPKTKRMWGYYRVLYEVDGTKVKELTVNPGCSLSMQRHEYRDEYWHIASGKCVVGHTYLQKHDFYRIPKHNWHQLSNPYDEPCKVIEIQYGSQCVEEDIERKT